MLDIDGGEIIPVALGDVAELRIAGFQRGVEAGEEGAGGALFGRVHRVTVHAEPDRRQDADQKHHDQDFGQGKTLFH